MTTNHGRHFRFSRTMLALVCLLAVAWTPVGQAAPELSGNVPLGSYVYGYLDKLDGLGLLSAMPPADRPYSRWQVAVWLLEMEKNLAKQPRPSALARAMLADLRRELSPEVARLSAGRSAPEPRLREWTAGVVSYDGDAAGYPAGRGSWQPLNPNGQGYRWNQGMNAYASFVWEGAIGGDAWLSLTPRFGWGEKDGAAATLQSGYVKLRSGNTEFLLGKDAMAWGQGRMGNLLLSDNATPLPRLQVSNIEPMHYKGLLRHLGAIHTKLFVSVLEDRKKWDGKDIDQPGMLGIRADFQPSPDFSFGLGYVSMFGGKGIYMGFDDYLKLLSGRTNVWNGQDKWNGIAGLDFRWRFPALGGMQLYGELYSEDNVIFGDWKQDNSRMLGLIAGLYIPRLSPSGNWDLNLEFASTGSAWYVHGLYTGGYTYGGQLLGDPMGGNAHRYSAKFTHYLDAKTQIGFRFDRVNQGISRPVQQRTNAIALSVRHRLADDLLMELTGGLASRDNADFIIGAGKKSKFVSCSISQRF